MAKKKKTSRKRKTGKKRVLSGLGATRRKKSRKKKAAKGRWKRVSRKAAVRKSGKKKGKLKKGCKFVKGDGAMCRTGRATKKRKSSKRKSSKKRGRKKTAKKQHLYSPNSSLPFKKGKTKKKVLKKGCRRVTKGKHRGKISCRRKMSRRKRAA